MIWPLDAQQLEAFPVSKYLPPDPHPMTLEPIPVPAPDWPVPREALDRILQSGALDVPPDHPYYTGQVVIAHALKEIDDRLKAVERR